MNTTAIQVQGREIVEMLTDPSVERRFFDAMETRAVRPYVQNVITEVARRPDLWGCDPESVMVSALQIALLRLNVEPSLGHACLVPFKDGRTGMKKCTKIVMVRGLKQLMIRTNQYTDIHSEGRVWEGQHIEQDEITGRVQIVGKPTSYTKIVGRLSYFRMTDGYEKVKAMTIEEIHAHARQFSPGYNMPGSFWKNPKSVGAMEEKTPFRLLVLHDGYLDPFEMGLVRGEETPPIAPPPAPPQMEEHNLGRGVRNAEEIRGWLHERADALAKEGKRVASVQQRGLMVQVFGRCWDFEPNADVKRQAVMKAVTGFDADGMSNQMPGVYVLAVLEWLKPEQVEGRWVPCAEARGEARGVWEAESRRQNAEGSGG